ncbi:MAG: hypothetical protein ABFC96_03540 [Thermoguttaceae bacterium]
MEKSLLDKLTDALRGLPGDWLRYLWPAAVGAILLWVVWRLVRRRKRPQPLLLPELKIEVAALPDVAPPPGLPALELYNLPVRLAAIVVAPVGVDRELPPVDELGPLLDAVLPGLDKVAALHRPLVRCWPHQVSARGFAHLFFANVRLPGDWGKGTPWSSVAGLAKVAGEPVMVGLVLRAASSNSLGQTVIDAENKWLACLRVRWG